MKKVVLIVAGGEGQRMNSSIPKQFQELQGLPILMHSINAFDTYDSSIRIILVLNRKYDAHWQTLCQGHVFNVKHEIIFGGASRFESVKNGLAAIKGDVLIAIHDSVRPLVSQETISSVFDTAVEKGNAVPCIPLNDSIRIQDKDGNEAKDRSSFVLIQTPQCFKSDQLLNAYDVIPQEEFTDDASVVEAKGHAINLVDGNYENIKITLPKDFLIANALLNRA